jgi:hypothetical protein
VVVADFFLHTWPAGDLVAADTGVNCNKDNKSKNAKHCFLLIDT